MRLTIRQMMILVVAVAVSMAAGDHGLRVYDRLHRRSEIYHQRARWHAIGANPEWYVSSSSPRWREYFHAHSERVAWNRRMVQKYERAAAFPWLAVEPDTPAPE